MNKKQIFIIIAIIVLAIVVLNFYKQPKVEITNPYFCNTNSDCEFTGQAWMLSNDTYTDSCCLNKDFLATAKPQMAEQGGYLVFNCMPVNCTCVEHKCEEP